MIGGPVAKCLITRYDLAPDLDSDVVDTTGFEQPKLSARSHRTPSSRRSR
nr:sodium/glutamate symporter [Pararobbsia silviterrae]